MKKEFDIQEILNNGISSEFDYERSLIADRRLRLLSKKDASYKSTRSSLRDQIEKYEKANWTADRRVSNIELLESELAEFIAEEERAFIQIRKKIIRERLSQLGLNQQQLGKILGHTSKTHMSELMNGLSAFTLRDLILISRLLKIDMDNLIPPFVNPEERKKVISTIKELKATNLKLDDNFSLVSA